MDCEMETAETATKRTGDESVDIDWQIDSEWIDLSSSSISSTSNNTSTTGSSKKKTRGESAVNKAFLDFHFIPTNKGGRHLLIDNHTLRLSQKKDSGFSYWVCNIPCCTARCILDPDEKKITKYSGDHNHDIDVNRLAYKKFINTLKVAVKANPNLEPRVLYDKELEKARENWMEGRSDTENEEPCLPSFDVVCTAMHNTRNAVLSSLSLKAVKKDGGGSEQQAGPSRSTRQREGRSSGKRKSIPSKNLSTDMDEMFDEDNEDSDENEDSTMLERQAYNINFYFMPSSRGVQVLVIDDCLLHQFKSHPSGKSYWKCQRKGCIFRAAYDSNKNQITKMTGVHNHPPDSHMVKKRHFVNSVKNQIADCLQLQPKQILDIESSKDQLNQGESSRSDYSSTKHHFYRPHKVVSTELAGDEDDDEALSAASKEDVNTAGSEITESERQFLEEASAVSQPHLAGINMSILTPHPVKSRNYPDLCFYFMPSRKGKRILVVNDFTFRLNSQKTGGRFYWKCTVEPCMYRCVYNQTQNDIVKVTGKHTHVSNVHRLRIQEFLYLLKTRMAEDSTLTPKRVYYEELTKLQNMENGDMLVKCMPPYASVRTSLYNHRNKKTGDEEFSSSANGSDGNNYSMYSLSSTNFVDELQGSGRHQETTQDISPKDITHLSLEDNDPMEHDEDEKGASSGSSSSSPHMEIVTPNLFDSHDLIDQFPEAEGKEKAHGVKLQQESEDNGSDQQVIMLPDLSTYAISFVPTNRGGRALVVNDCVLRISYTRESVTYWRCQKRDCLYRCSYDSKSKRLLRVSGDHNHPVNSLNLAIRLFIRKLKKRICQESDLSPKIIYEEEIQRLRNEGRAESYVSKFPGYDSLKSSLYKVKNLATRPSVYLDLEDLSSDDSDMDKNEDNFHSSLELKVDIAKLDSSQVECSVHEPPYDQIIESGYALLNSYLCTWLDESPEKRIVDGHLLVRKGSTDTSTWWICFKDVCPFRCVILNRTGNMVKGEWDHTHRSDIKHVITQTLFNAVKRRAVMDPCLVPKTIYLEEKKRLEKKIHSSNSLLRFVPNFTQVYQQIIKSRANPLPSSILKSSSPTKVQKQSKSKKQIISQSRNSCLNSAIITNEGTNELCNDIDSTSTFVLDNHPKLNPHVEAASNRENDQYTNAADLNDLHQSIPSYSYSLDRQMEGLLNVNPPADGKGPQFSPSSHQQQLFLHSNQQPQQHIVDSKTVQYSLAVSSPQGPKTDNSSSKSSSPLSGHHSPCFHISGVFPQQHINENVFTLHGYPLILATTQAGNIYWQCRIPGCQFQCVLNTATSQIVRISGNHNHEPPDSKSSFCSQVVKMLQRKSAEYLDQPLHKVYLDYMQSLHDLLDSDEIMSGLPRFQDVLSSMQAARAAMGVEEELEQDLIGEMQGRNLTNASQTQSSNQSRKPACVVDFHFDQENNLLVVNDESLELSWKMHEISFWKCKRAECRFKCVLDDETQAVHILNNHSMVCSSAKKEDEPNAPFKRKHPETLLHKKCKYPRLDPMKE